MMPYTVLYRLRWIILEEGRLLRAWRNIVHRIAVQKLQEVVHRPIWLWCLWT